MPLKEKKNEGNTQQKENSATHTVTRKPGWRRSLMWEIPPQCWRGQDRTEGLAQPLSLQTLTPLCAPGGSPMTSVRARNSEQAVSEVPSS